MIRRDAGTDWLIVSQIDHAHLAAELAQSWRCGGSPYGGPGDLLLHAVWNHDDGWRTWETAMEVDPQTGIPRQFTEMVMSEAAEIWTDSIRKCAAEHPLAGLWVSGHFCFLAEQSLAHRGDEDPESDDLQVFLATQREYQCDLRDAALEHLTPRELSTMTRFGRQFLRLFDGLSLWFCCAERSEPFDVQFAGLDVQFVPVAAERVVVTPFILSDHPLQLSVPARRVEARKYTDDTDFQSAFAAAPVEQLTWTLLAETDESPRP